MVGTLLFETTNDLIDPVNKHVEKRRRFNKNINIEMKKDRKRGSWFHQCTLGILLVYIRFNTKDLFTSSLIG